MRLRVVSRPVPQGVLSVALLLTVPSPPVVPSVPGAPAPPRAPAVTVLGIDGLRNATPTVAVRGATVAVVWSAASASTMNLWSAVSRDSGRTFGAPVRVNAVEGDARVSGETPPRVALVPSGRGDPDVVVVWTAKRDTRTALLWARSHDGGRRFGATTEVPGSSAEGMRGWQSVAVDARGRVGVLWLDHRNLAGAHGAHGTTPAGAPGTTDDPRKPDAPKAPLDPTAKAARSAVHFAWLDGQTSQVLATSVCFCCKTALAASGGRLAAAWRHVYPGSVRDIAYTSSANGGRSFAPLQRVSEDRWQLDGCPDNGPALALDARQWMVAVWPAPATDGHGGALGIFAAVAPPTGRFGARVRLPVRGPAGHPQVVATGPGRALAVWDEVVDGERRLAMAALRWDGDALMATAVAPPEAGAGQWYPAMAGEGGQAVAVWVRQQDGGSRIGVARLAGGSAPR